MMYPRDDAGSANHAGTFRAVSAIDNRGILGAWRNLSDCQNIVAGLPQRAARAIAS